MDEYAVAARFTFDASSYPNTEHAYARLLSLPMFPALADSEQDQVVQALRSIVAS